MNFVIILAIFFSLLTSCFSSCSFIDLPLRIKKGQEHSRKSTSVYRKLRCDLISHPLPPFADCCFIHLADWLWFDLLRSLLEWQTKRKLSPSPPSYSNWNRTGSYYLVSLDTIKKDRLILFYLLLRVSTNPIILWEFITLESLLAPKTHVLLLQLIYLPHQPGSSSDSSGSRWFYQLVY